MLYQRASRRIGVIGFEPNQRPMQNPGLKIANHGIERGNRVDPIAAQRSERHSQRERCAIKSSNAAHANTALNNLDRQSAHQKARMQSVLREGPGSPGEPRASPSE